MNINKNIFREYDIRGKYPMDINEDIAYTIGLSYGSYIQEKLHKKAACVGRDVRYSSSALATSLIQGMLDSGIDVVDFGECTTPMYYYGCIKTKNIIGIMVTASHNPKDDNGFKFSFDNLGNARGEMVYDFRDYTLKGKFLSGKGTLTNYNVLPVYKNLMKNSIKMGKRKLKVVFDLGNATCALIIKDIIKLFPNIEPIYLFDDIDPSFPNHHPDPAVESNTIALQEKVKQVHADLGVSYDGDGDRLGIVDDQGNYVATDKLMAILIQDICNENQEAHILYDLKCSNVVNDTILKAHGIPHEYRTGASYTRYKTVLEGYLFGGEFSGHFTFNDRFPGFDSGIYASLRLMEILSNHYFTSIHKLIKELPVYVNSSELKMPTSDDYKFEVINRVINYCKEKNYQISTMDGVKVYLENGWALVRASNTGPHLTLRFEAKTEEDFQAIKEEFTEITQKNNHE